MAKHTYRITDPSGVEHKRTTGRTYTHVVFTLPSHDCFVENAHAKGHLQTDRNNFAYYSRIATGNDPYPAKTYRDQYPDKWTPEQIEEERVEVEAENAKRITDAQEKIAGHTEESYCAQLLQERLDRIEKRRQDGYFETWQVAGWCGRPDLAAKQANAEQAKRSVTKAAVVEVPQLVEAE